MVCFTLHSAVQTNNVEQFESYLKDNPNCCIPFELEDQIITEHKKDFLSLLIKYNCISDQGLTLSGVFDRDNKLFYNMEHML